MYTGLCMMYKVHYRFVYVDAPRVYAGVNRTLKAWGHHQAISHSLSPFLSPIVVVAGVACDLQ